MSLHRIESCNDIVLEKQDGRITTVEEDTTDKGDTNNNGTVNILDAWDALSMSVRLIAEDLNADMDNSGRVTAEDARLILVMAIQ
ncbi:MAG: hypothetical protein HN341_05345 [Verrucomicrobia bacterium]|jgi:hypothetical protein|nr:hypothetical protein [Verrucomicrobiota bacterium]